jgi:hypothetical protein
MILVAGTLTARYNASDDNRFIGNYRRRTEEYNAQPDSELGCNPAEVKL